MSVRDAIESRLSERLRPEQLEIIDDSARHAGHAGARPGGETHFEVTIVSAKFKDLGRLARQRLVHEALADLLRDRIHALSLRTLTPEEHEPG